MIDLSKFVAKNVQLTFRDGGVQTGYIQYNPLSSIWYDYIFCYDSKYRRGYTRLGKFWVGSVSDLDIIHIEEIKPMNKYEELEKQVAEMQKEIDRLKAEDKKKPEITIENASIGDVLEDGSIVVHKTDDNMAFLAAPATTEVRCEWSKEFSPVFEALKSQGFSPSQWFVPTEEQLKITYENCKQHFASTFYWSSTEFNATTACCQDFTNGYIFNFNKTNTRCVRAFRCVSF
jgi:hypothetical protein